MQEQDAVFSGVSWKYHNNVEYIEINFTGLTTDNKIIECVSNAVKMALPRPNKSIRALILAKGLKTTPISMRTIKQLGKEVQPKLSKSAMVSPVGIMSLLMKIYTNYTGSKIKFFTDKKAALKYLTDD